MKSWLGVVGRACIEFAIILILLSFAVGASSSVTLPVDTLRPIYVYAAWSALGLVPLAALLTLFLAFFSVELRIRSRIAGWLCLFCLGALLFAFGIGLRRADLVRQIVVQPEEEKPALQFIPAGAAIQRSKTAVWIGSYAGREAVDAVAVDFGSDYPRLSYAPSAPLSLKTGEVEIDGRNHSAVLPDADRITLVPGMELFAGSWIWDRLSAMDDEPAYLPFAAAGGFLLLVIGFRFLCRLSGWPLANVFLSAAGLIGLAVLDAMLSGPEASAFALPLARRYGLGLPWPLLLACAEAAAGILLGLADIAAGGRGRRYADA